MLMYTYVGDVGNLLNNIISLINDYLLKSQH
jgi:hypothetical protein